jgi:hypothetical protein
MPGRLGSCAPPCGMSPRGPAPPPPRSPASSTGSTAWMPPSPTDPAALRRRRIPVVDVNRRVRDPDVATVLRREQLPDDRCVGEEVSVSG